MAAPQSSGDLGNHRQHLTAEPRRRVVNCVDERVKTFDDYSYQHEHEIVEPTPSLLLQSLTTKKAIDMFNMERLETLGDSFLKLTTSSYFYCKLPVLNEGYLSTLKVNQISNNNLHRLANAKGLADYMIAHQFQPSYSWLPPGFRVHMENEMETETEIHTTDLHSISLIEWNKECCDIYELAWDKSHRRYRQCEQ